MSLSSRSRNSDLSRRPSNFSSATKPKPTTVASNRLHDRRQHPLRLQLHPHDRRHPHRHPNNPTRPSTKFGEKLCSV
ncbi:hypothetical protein ACFX12_037482 [Malus domestica]